MLEILASLTANLLATIGTAFIAGVLASAVCPCTLPVGLGIATVTGASEAESRRGGLAIASAFFLGIVGSLTTLGLVASQLGALVTEAFGRNWALAMAFLSFLAALVAFWWPRMPFKRLTAWRRPGLIGAFVYGVIFSLGTSVAPLLLLLTVAASTAAPAEGVLMAFVFGLGRGLPFLLTGIAASTLTRLTRLSLWSRPLQIASGIALIFVGGYFVRIYTDLL